MGAKVLTERMSFTGVTVGGTAEAPVVQGVLACGATSANRRRYLRTAFEGGRVERYNGAPVYLNHGKGPDGRPYQEQIGLVQNARLREDGLPLIDIAVNPEKEGAKAFVWDARHQPKACGMSHVAHCETVAAKDGWDEVTEIVRVESVDVISAGNAATTKGLNEGTMTRISLKQFAERFGPKMGPARWGALQKLCEDLGAPADVTSMDAPAADAEVGDLKAALVSALAPMLDDAFDSGDPTALIAALKDFIKLHAKHTGKEVAAEPAETPSEESRRKAAAAATPARPDPWAVLAEAQRLVGPSYNPGPAELEALAGLPSAEARKAFLAEQKARANPAQPAKSAGRYVPLSEGTAQKVAEGVAPDVKDFLGRVME